MRIHYKDEFQTSSSSLDRKRILFHRYFHVARTFEFFEISSFSHSSLSQRVAVYSVTNVNIDRISRQSVKVTLPHSKLSPRQNISPIGMIHDLPVERRVQQREREIKEIRVDCVARRRTIRLEYTRFNRRRC